MKTIELDIVTEDITLDEAVEELGNIEGITVLIVSERPDVWPSVTLAVTPEAMPKLEEWYGGEIVDED